MWFEQRNTRTHVRRVLHGRSTGRDLGGVALDERSVDGVGERKLGEVLGDVLLHLVLLEAGGLAESLGGDDGGGVGLVREGGNVGVGDDADLGKSQRDGQRRGVARTSDWECRARV
jgi:hypothetical protein